MNIIEIIIIIWMISSFLVLPILLLIILNRLKYHKDNNYINKLLREQPVEGGFEKQYKLMHSKLRANEKNNSNT